MGAGMHKINFFLFTHSVINLPGNNNKSVNVSIWMVLIPVEIRLVYLMSIT